MQYLDAVSKMTEWSVCQRQGKPFKMTVIQVYAPTSNAEEAKVGRFYEDLQNLLELTPKKDVLFIIGDWNAKVGSQEIPGVTGKLGLGTKWSRTRTNWVLPRECTGHSKYFLPTTQQQTLGQKTLGEDKWTSLDGQYRNQTDYIRCSQRWRSSIQSAKTRLGDDCVLDHELLIAKFRLKLKNIEKTTGPFRYDLKSNPLWLYSGSNKHI